MLTHAEIDSLVHAKQGDPFALLGPHRAAEGATWWVRSFQPGAREVELLDAKGEVLASLASIHPAGLFELELELELELEQSGLELAPYRLRVSYANGFSEQLEDPYRFGSSLGELDLHLFAEGTHLRPWRVLGAHLIELDGVAGVRFCVWAPNAGSVCVIGGFNHWDGRRHPMRLHLGCGVWELFIPGAGEGTLYKYELRTREGDLLPAKADPYAFCAELRPATASVVVAPPKPARRSKPRELDTRAQPMSIYEVHLGSWRRGADNSMLDWDALAASLPAYAVDMGFTHLELLPISEHPFDGSWGYQVTGMYAPTRRFGDPAGFARFVAACHAAGLGLLLDWVPAHFPGDAHALARFDGTGLYEYEDPREGVHRDWDTLIYNFSRHEVRTFLVGSALYWLEEWGLDGLRVDAVASMLYRDYSREPGQWVPNVNGGRENLEAVSLLRRMNEVVDAEVPGCITIAEESTSWPGVSRPTSEDGLGFHYKWNMGWMHDTLAYMAKDPIHRSHHHNEITFGLVYAFSENFVLPISHDEVVHGKGSLINKMVGDHWQRFASLRAYLGFMWTYPGKKLLFMGCEFAQLREWNHDRSLDWHLLDERNPEGGDHRGVQRLVRDLNHLYRERPALHGGDCVEEGFEWLVADDAARSVFAYLRKHEGAQMLVVCNFTPVPRDNYRVGVPEPSRWRERLNTDSSHYAGSNVGNGTQAIASTAESAWGRAHSIALRLPPLATVIFERA